ncbi:LysR family transcriptional regulator [Acidimangrovimonas sediminis]|uniref:LysR family transcriptional regulator n=1 Tax=Acidimangrovimonas sediminis TaxID=2056283 RepID=UPI000C7FD161|nr:LysR family transcriptional regulator [Acidimangrovimonas sediminis]
MDDPKLMRLLVAIVDAGSLSAVARLWGVAPSTVSHGLRQLEERLGTQLVVRSTRQLSLTPEGRDFAERSRQILADIDEAMAGVRDGGPVTGHLRITATNDLGRQRIAPLIDAFMRRHKGLSVQLYLSDSLVDLVENGYDLAFRTGPLADSDLRARLLLRARKCICAAPSYWEAHGRPEHPRDLAGHNCMIFALPGETQTNWPFTENGQRFRVRVSGDRSANDGQALRAWAIAGAGVVMKSHTDIADDIKAGRLETVLESYAQEASNLYAVTPPRVHTPRRLQLLLDFLSAELSGAD